MPKALGTQNALSFSFNQFISNSKSLLCQAGGKARVGRPWKSPLSTWCIDAIVCPLTTAVPTGPDHTVPQALRPRCFQDSLGTGESLMRPGAP